MNKNAKQKKAERVKAEEAALNRILCWIAGGVVLEFLVLLLARYTVYYKVSEYDIHVAVTVAAKILTVAGLCCAAGAGFWWNSARKSGKGTNLPGTLCLFMVGLSVSCFASWVVYRIGVDLMRYVVPAVVVLALIYYLYQREFFVIAAQSLLALLGIWMCDKGVGSGYNMLCYAFVAVAAVLIVLSALLCRKAQGEEGVVKMGDRSWKCFSRDASYALLYVGAVVSLLTLIVAAIGIAPLVLYAAVVAWLLIMAVYYTVKLM